MKHILLGLLLHCFFFTVKPECVYQLGFEHQVLCNNMQLKEGDILKLEGQKDPDTGVNFLTLNGVSGVLTELTVSLFPKANVTVQNSTIEKLNLPSHKAVEFLNTTLSGANSPQFWKDCCSNIETLEVVSSKDPVSIEHFKSLNQLKRLFLVNEPVIPKHLTKSTFEGMSSLESLHLHKVGLEEVDEDAFENLPNLNGLSLSDNTITQMKPNTFKSLTNLEELDLTGNDIENLSLEMLSEQKQMKKLMLHTKDFLKFGADETKKAFPKLEDISLDYEDKFTPEARNFVKILGICPSYRQAAGVYLNTCI